MSPRLNVRTARCAARTSGISHWYRAEPWWGDHPDMRCRRRAIGGGRLRWLEGFEPCDERQPGFLAQPQMEGIDMDGDVGAKLEERLALARVQLGGHTKLFDELQGVGCRM